MNTYARAVLAAAALAVLAGCATATSPTQSPAPVTADVDCLADDVLASVLGVAGDGTRPLPPARTLPDDVRPVRLIECRWAPGDVPAPSKPEPATPAPSASATPTADPGTITVTIEQVTREGDLSDLLAQLRRPSQTPEPGTACPAMWESKPALHLIDAEGAAMRVSWPTTQCGFLLDGALDDLRAVPQISSELLSRTVPVR